MAKDYEDEGQLVRDVHQKRRDFRAYVAKWRLEAREDYDFYAGHQYSEEDEALLREQLRPAITMNRVAPMIDAVAGTEVNNRTEVSFLPREIGDAGANELLTNAARYLRDQCDAEDEETDAFIDCLICGMGWTETRIDFDDNPDGDLRIERFDPFEAGWDHESRKRNLVDAKCVWREREISREDFEAKWPGKAGEILSATPLDGMQDYGLSQDHMADEAWKYENDQGDNEGFNAKRDAFRVIQYQYTKQTKYYRVINPETGQMEELTPEAYKKVKPMLEAMGAPAVVANKRTYYQAFVCGETLLENEKMAVDHFTLNCITGKRDRNHNTWYGLVRAMKDPQRWANKFFSQILHVLNTNAKGGIVAEQDTFVDQRKAETDWARPDSIIMVQPGALAAGKIWPKPVGEYPQGLDRLMNFAIGSLREVTGVNVEMMGMADRQQAGVVEAQRKQAGLTILALLFDSLRRYRKRQGRVMLQFITRYLSDGRLVQIDGNLGAKYAPLIRDPQQVEYDVIVDEAPSSPNQKEKVWGLLQGILPHMMKLGMPVPPEVLDFVPLPESLVMAWKQMVQPPEPDPNAPPPEPSPEEMEAQAKAAKLQADAQLSQARAMEAQARAEGQGAELQMRQQVMQMELQLQQQKAQTEMQLQAMKMQMQMQIEQMKAELQQGVVMAQTRREDYKAEAQATLAQAKADTERVKQQRAMQQPSPKKDQSP